jgi:integrase
MRKRRGRGEGGIHQRADGLWQGTISLGYGADGKRKRRYVYGKTKAECIAKMRNRESPGSKLSLSAYLTQWLDAIKPTVEPATYRPYERHVRLYLTPHLGHVAVAKLTPLDVEALYAALSKSGVSAAMQRKVGTTLTIALGRAVKTRAIPSNPAALVKKPKAERKEIHPLTLEEARAFLTEAQSDRLFALYVLLIDAGLRPGEAFALEPGDVKNGWASVTKSLEDINGALRIKEVKTRKSRRRIKLSTWAADVLARMRRTGSGPLFTDSRGGYIRISNLERDSFKQILKRAGLRDIRLYDLRHTCATLLLSAGVNPKIVSERLGHSSVAFTLDVYSHVLPGMQDIATKALDWLQLGSRNGTTENAPASLDVVRLQFSESAGMNIDATAS